MPKPCAVPDGVIAFAVGDIHGRLDLLQRLHTMITEYMALHPAWEYYLIYLGDYIDRGPHSKEVVDAIMAFNPDKTTVITLKGNHEDVLNGFFDDVTILPLWAQYGGLATFQSYGVYVDTPTGLVTQLKLKDALDKAMPEKHRTFYKELRVSFTLGDYFFVHAGINPHRPLHKQHPYDLLYIRTVFLDSTTFHGKMIVHGHSIVPQAMCYANRIAVDSGAYRTNILSAVVLEGTRHTFLTTQ
jgi:serine/threonine protein phosphatase 1